MEIDGNGSHVCPTVDSVLIVITLLVYGDLFMSIFEGLLNPTSQQTIKIPNLKGITELLKFRRQLLCDYHS
jgi:hypothetical protein